MFLLYALLETGRTGQHAFRRYIQESEAFHMDMDKTLHHSPISERLSVSFVAVRLGKPLDS